MNWLKRRRTEIGISQEALARQLQLAGQDVSRAAIGHWETDRYDPPLQNEDFRRALANILQIDTGELLREAGYEVLNSKHSRLAERAAYLIDQMNPEDQKKALKILEALVN